MNALLRDCYYSGMSLEDAVAYIKRAYWETPTQAQIDRVIKSLGKDTTWN